MCGLALLALAVGTAAAPRPVLSPANFFPLQPGTTWVYQVSGAGGGVREVVAKLGVSPVGLRGGVLLEGYFPGPARLVRSSGGTVDELGPGGEAYPWYLLAAPEGTSWTLRLAPVAAANLLPCIDGARLTVASRNETVAVPAGRFDSVVLVRWETPCRDAGIHAEWFAPGVGLVKREEGSFAGILRWELKELRRGQLPPVPPYGAALALSRRHYVLDLMPPVDRDRLPYLEGTLALWLFDPVPDGEPGVPLCLEVVGEIEDENHRPVTSFAIPDPGCLVLAPMAFSRYRLIPFAWPLLAGGTPLPQGSYTLRVEVRTRGWDSTLSLPFSVSHVY